MRFYQQIVIVALLMQLLVSCHARTRFTPDSWNEMEEIDVNENNSNDEYEYLARAIPLYLKGRKLALSGINSVNEERRKAYLGETTNHQGRRGLQGLWAMPGRR